MASVMAAVLSLLPAFTAADIIDRAIPTAQFPRISLDIFILLMAACIGAALAFLQALLNSKTSVYIMSSLRVAMASHVHIMPMSFFSNSRTGELMNRVSSDIDSTGGIFNGTISGIITSVLTLTITIPVIFVLSWQIAVVSLLLIPLFILPLPGFARHVYTANLDVRTMRDVLGAHLHETLSPTAVMTIKAFTTHSSEQSKLLSLSMNLADLQVRATMIGRRFNLALGGMVLVAPSLVWLCGGWLAIHGGLKLGVIVATLALIQGRLYPAVCSLANVRIQISGVLAVFDRIFAFLDSPTEPTGTGSDAPLCVIGEVTFTNVGFCYDTRDLVLQGITFTARPGNIIAIVGPSGSGKSTIVRLLCRYFEVLSGEIQVDGRDVREWPLSQLRSQLGVISQDTHLFNDSIWNNIRYGCLDASEVNIIEAAKSARIYDIVQRLPNGFDTIVCERGHRFSNGERQRIAIARVILQNPRILILDEAMNALDSENELAIQEALDFIMAGKTTIIISHRLSSIMSADEILVLSNGTIAERGQHDYLLARKGLYAKLYHEQTHNQHTQSVRNFV